MARELMVKGRLPHLHAQGLAGCYQLQSTCHSENYRVAMREAHLYSGIIQETSNTTLKRHSKFLIPGVNLCWLSIFFS